MRRCVVLLIPFCTAALMLGSSQLVAQQTTSRSTSLPGTMQGVEETAGQLENLVKSLDGKRQERELLATEIDGSPEDRFPEKRARVIALNEEIERLKVTYELVALGETNTGLLTTENEGVFDWQQEMVEIAKPVFDSLRTLTEKPRKISELNQSIALSLEKQKVATAAVDRLQALIEADNSDLNSAQLNLLLRDWNSKIESIEQQLLSDQTQLNILKNDKQPLSTSLSEWFSGFIFGRGLTLLLALFWAILTWGFLRFCWWIYRTRFTNKKVRRKATWYRLLSYSYYLFSFVLVWIVVIAVLYTRQDFLLLAMALLLTVIVTLSLRQAIPQYIKEARLLLNIGSVREDERVMYKGLPWQVNSINLESVFWNPALEGVIRLPIENLSGLISRPATDDLWFPSRKGDYLLLPDGTFGQVLLQTPDMVQLSAKGGASLTYATDQFYTMNIVNLSAFDTFGVAVTFGLDYELQAISLSEVPEVLETACLKALEEAGFAEGTNSIYAGLKSAGASSLDFLIYGSFSSKLAGNYYTLERTIQQTCVAVANERGWNIPYPQLTVHTQTPVS